ncbi:GTP cyclohydrolase II-domain-containing protein [Fimicolochytrium jonesii]|uniref:GTP cyclohydrolase II-domain-containing protein n=1 Tax=Fimicolochytrium jonesii TaxID=1396493 RepID=UPI0022FDD881|nr:GTP cyclohydrolase II-domain-containing protein [Fimicolochytrium jonesii]KAI8822122.1 GTP cyclohydrolase II-domain-containing protein [Fimicolochytrium jonesii]
MLDMLDGRLSEQSSPLFAYSEERAPSPFTTQQSSSHSRSNGLGFTAAVQSIPPSMVRCEVRTRLPSEFGGECHVHMYSNNKDNEEHLALVYGEEIQSASLEEMRSDDTPEERMLRGVRFVDGVSQEGDARQRMKTTPPLVRIHSCCFTGETLGSLRCDCAEQLKEAMRMMAEEGSGIVLYLNQEGRGIGLKEKLRAYNLIDLGYDTMAANIALGHPADARTYEIASAMLKDLGIHSARLLTNNPDKLQSLQKDGIDIVERVPMIPASWRRLGDGMKEVADATAHDTQTRMDAGSQPTPPASPEPSHHDPHSRRGHATNPASSRARQLQDRDEYLVTKVQRMGHILNIPSQVLEAVNKSTASHSPSPMTPVSVGEIQWT